jgi:hypothetical protein
VRDHQRLRRRLRRGGQDHGIINCPGTAAARFVVQSVVTNSANRSRDLITVDRETPTRRAAPEVPGVTVTEVRAEWQVTGVAGD